VKPEFKYLRLSAFISGFFFFPVNGYEKSFAFLFVSTNRQLPPYHITFSGIGNALQLG